MGAAPAAWTAEQFIETKIDDVCDRRPRSPPPSLDRVGGGAVARGIGRLSDAQADTAVARFAESGVPLGADQAAAPRGVLTSGARVESLIAAAGTGKSLVVGAIADA
jgi:hypothetical protein